MTEKAKYCDAVCAYAHNGECRFALVHEREPEMTDADGCLDYVEPAEHTSEMD